MLRPSFEEAAALAAELSTKLASHPDRPVETATFVPIPRGGWVVLGLLAYHLGSRLRTPSSDREAHPLAVVIDDCAVTGSRFARTLDSLPAERVIFAHLLSPAATRQAILEVEPRVVACMAARDLEIIPDPGIDEAAVARWRARLPGRRYWIGRVEPFSFPWGEPDVVFWNERTRQVESDWRRASPRQCLENRQVLLVPWDGPAGAGFDVPAHAVWKVTPGGDVLIWHERRDRVFSLEGSGAAMWRALAATGSVGRSLAFLTSVFDAPQEQLRRDLVRLAEQLVAEELLTPPGA